MTDKIIVAYVADERYLPYLKVSMDSVKRYNKNVEFAILTSQPFEVPGAQVYTFEPDIERFKFKPNDRMHEGVYYKFYLPKLPYEKILYIDCDVICQRPLNPLWEEPCEFICGTESHAFGKKQAAQLGVPKYMLTGMMLMNLKALREADFTNKCLEMLDKTTALQHDETIINLAFHDRLRFVDVKYNYCRNRRYANPIPESDAYLLHYVGERKEDMLRRDNFSRLNYLKGLLKGKSIAIVGNASSLLEKGQGEEIDSHDVVIRFNKGFPSDAVGHKTGILFLACTLDLAELARFGVALTVRRSKLCKNICNYSISIFDRLQLCQTVTPAAKKRSIVATKCQPSTGFIAINFALSTECKSIDLYGFDFFKTQTYYNEKDYQTLHNGSKEEEKILEYAKWGLLCIK